MLTAEQLAIRATGVGSSEAPAAIGLSPYLTPLQLYLIKRGEAPPVKETMTMRFGNAVEPFILDEFRRAHPDMQLVASPDTMRRGVMLAHLDAWQPGAANVQIKTARTRNGWGEPGTDQVPTHYLIQVQAEMLVAGVSVTFIPVLFGGADYDEFVVEADRELQEMVEAGVEEFWQKVQRAEPPPPVSFADVVAKYGRVSQARVVKADSDTVSTVYELRMLRDKIADLEAREEAARAKVMLAMAEADTLADPHTGDVLATWKASKPSQRLDSKALKAAMPDIYAQFLKAGEPSRRFLLKEAS